MKFMSIIFLIAFFWNCSSLKNNVIDNGCLKYVYKYKQDCEATYENDKERENVYRIYLKHPIIMDSLGNPMRRSYSACTYQVDRVFALYSKDEQIEILKELLSFRNDTDLAGIDVKKWGGTKSCNPEPITKQYTLQTDALYLFTILSMGFDAQIYCPYPVLINKETGNEVSNYEEIVRVFDIYEDWLNKYSSIYFQDVYHPLYGTKYSWYRCAREEYADTLMIQGLNAGWGSEFNGHSNSSFIKEKQKKIKLKKNPSIEIWEKETKKLNKK